MTGGVKGNSGCGGEEVGARCLFGASDAHLLAKPRSLNPENGFVEKGGSVRVPRHPSESVTASPDRGIVGTFL